MKPREAAVAARDGIRAYPRATIARAHRPPAHRSRREEKPDDPSLIALQWRVLLTTEEWSAATSVGETLRRIDPLIEGTADVFLRQALAYRNGAQPVQALATMAEGVSRHTDDADISLLYLQLVASESDTALARGRERFPKNGKLLAYDAQLRRKRGDLRGALASTRQALSSDGTLERGSVQLAQAYLDVGEADSALVVLGGGLRDAADSALAGQFALARGNTPYRQATASGKRADTELSPRFLLLSTRLAPSPNAGFLAGAAATGVAQAALDLAAPLLANNAAASPEAARQLADYATQARPYRAQQIRLLCGATVGPASVAAPPPA